MSTANGQQSVKTASRTCCTKVGDHWNRCPQSLDRPEVIEANSSGPYGSKLLVALLNHHILSAILAGSQPSLRYSTFWCFKVPVRLMSCARNLINSGTE